MTRSSKTQRVSRSIEKETYLAIKSLAGTG